MNSEPQEKYIFILYHAIAYTSILLRDVRHQPIVFNAYFMLI